MKIWCAVILLFAAVTSLQSQHDCNLKIDKDSIKVYTCHTDTSRFKYIVTELAVKATLDQLVHFVMDIPNYTQWQYNTIKATTIRKISESDQIYRTVVEAPWPVTDRDMVVHIRSKVAEDQKSLLITTDSEKGIMPEKKELVRVPSSHGEWTVTQIGNRLQIRYVMQIDPGGSVPAWLANWVCANAPYQSFKKLKTQLEK